MCNYYSCLVTKDLQVLDDPIIFSHDELANKYGLKQSGIDNAYNENALKDREYVAIEIVPLAGEALFTGDRAKWKYRVDEPETLPEWYFAHENEIRIKAWQAWEKHHKSTFKNGREILWHIEQHLDDLVVKCSKDKFRKVLRGDGYDFKRLPKSKMGTVDLQYCYFPVGQIVHYVFTMLRVRYGTLSYDIYNAIREIVGDRAKEQLKNNIGMDTVPKRELESILERISQFLEIIVICEMLGNDENILFSFYKYSKMMIGAVKCGYKPWGYAVPNVCIFGDDIW